MNDTDRMFNHTIVGAPMVAVMGRRARLPKRSERSERGGAEVNMRTAGTQLSAKWANDSTLWRPIDPAYAGLTRTHYEGLAGWVQHHAMQLAVLGWLVALAMGAWVAALLWL